MGVRVGGQGGGEGEGEVWGAKPHLVDEAVPRVLARQPAHEQVALGVEARLNGGLLLAHGPLESLSQCSVEVYVATRKNTLCSRLMSLTYIP